MANKLLDSVLQKIKSVYQQKRLSNQPNILQQAAQTARNTFSPINMQTYGNNLRSAYQEWKTKPSNQIANQMLTEQGVQGLRQQINTNSRNLPASELFRSLGNYGVSLASPIIQTPQQARMITHPAGNTKSERNVNRLQGTMGTLYGVANLVQPEAQPIMSGINAWMGANLASQRGQPNKVHAESALAGLTGESMYGPGEVVSTNPGVQTAVNLASIPAMIFAPGAMKKLGIKRTKYLNNEDVINSMKNVVSWESKGHSPVSEFSPQQYIEFKTGFEKAASELASELTNSRGMKALLKSDPTTWRRYVADYLGNRLYEVNNPGTKGFSIEALGSVNKAQNKAETKLKIKTKVLDYLHNAQSPDDAIKMIRTFENKALQTGDVINMQAFKSSLKEWRKTLITGPGKPVAPDNYPVVAEVDRVLAGIKLKPINPQKAVQEGVARVKNKVPVSVKPKVKTITEVVQESAKPGEIKIQKPPEDVPQKKLFGWFDEVRRRLENEYHPVEKVGQIATKRGLKLDSWQSPELLVKRNLGSTGIAEGELMGLGDIVKPHASEVNELISYMNAKRVPDYVARGKRTGINPEKAKAIVEAGAPRFEATAQKLYMYQRSIMHNYLVDTGVLSEDAFRLIIKENPNYVPWNRVISDLTGESGGMVPNKAIRSPLKRVTEKGSDLEIKNNLESMISNTYKSVTVGEQNRLWRSVAQIGEQFPDMGIKKTKPKYAPVATVDGEKIFRPSFFNPSPNSISFFENGKRVFYEVPPEISRVANQLGRSQNLLMKILSFPTKVVRTGATGLNPEFAMLRNPLKDQFSALWNSESGYIPFVDFFKGVSHMSGNDDLYRQYMLSGAGQSYMVSLDQAFKSKSLQQLLDAGTKKNLLKRGLGTVTHPINTIQELSKLSEMGTRLGEYQRALKKTSDPLKAAKASREVTVDFGRIGTDTRVANQLIAFLNARVQGTIQAVKSAMKHPARAGAIGVSLGALPATLLYLHNRQYPEYYDIQDFEKNNNWIVMYGKPGEAKMFEIPKDYIVGQLFGSSTENMLAYMDKTDPNAMKSLASNVFNFFSPVSNMGDVLPTAVKPPIEAATNYNFFLKRPIVPEYQKQLPSEAQYNAGTREVSKIIGSRIGVSPAIIDNYLYGYAPGIYSQAINLVDFALGGKSMTEAKKLPFIRVFTVSGTGKVDQQINELYYGLQDKKNTLNAIMKSKNYTDEQKKGLVEKQLKEMGNMVSQLNQYIKIKGGDISNVDMGKKFETENVPYTPPGLAKGVSAAENIQPVNKPLAKTNPSTQTGEFDFTKELAKQQLKFSAEPWVQSGNSILLKKGDSIVDIDLDQIQNLPQLPTLTGDDTLDKMSISKYGTQLNSIKNDIYDLYKAEIIPPDKAAQLIKNIDGIKTSLSKSTKKTGTRVKKVTVPKIKKVTSRRIQYGKGSKNKGNKIKFKQPKVTKPPSIKKVKVKKYG